ncbi:hypothetical protein HK102_004813 [Quaeritorhiza haematococci]|nr:hypothetical protein HK102_004813 [Quaeritorhiza haematococci]
MGGSGGRGGPVQYNNMPPQQHQHKVMTAEEFERVLENDVPTRITLSSDRRFSVDSDASEGSELNMAALSSKDAFYDYVSSANPDAFAKAGGQPGMPNGAPGGGPNGPAGGYGGGAGGRMETFDDLDDLDIPKRKPKTETQSLAEFLRTTGPELFQPNLPPTPTKKKRGTGIFKFGKKSKKKAAATQQEVGQNAAYNQQQQRAGSPPRPKHIPLSAAYAPLKDGQPSTGKKGIQEGFQGFFLGHMVPGFRLAYI